ncbi:MAG: RpiB/LacA/LacB family sugar-phosphate isomerase [Calditrichaeota bacterium]|nr:RpiB/LacA/LacB family sugar-phosphate isomerase [Calditrichota bacterium]
MASSSRQSSSVRWKNWGIETEDVGIFSADAVDYPVYAHVVAQRVARDETVVGIIVEGARVLVRPGPNQQGPGVCAAACYDPYTTRNSREHIFVNVLARLEAW